MASLNIYDPRERALVRAADVGLSAIAAIAAPFRRRDTPQQPPRRILLLRLERIGDLLMSAAAIADVRVHAPDAEIDLVVGSWNAQLAAALQGPTRVEVLDVPWLTRDGTGQRGFALLAAARHWRTRRYDLAINFEPDIRSNIMLALSGARRIAGFNSAGGGPLLDLSVDFDPRAHTADSGHALVARVFGSRPLVVTQPVLKLPANVVAAAAKQLSHKRPLVGVHASGGRAIKQWDPERFGEVARRLIAERGATIALTGSAADRPIVDAVKRVLPANAVVDLCGDVDLLTLAATVARLDLLVTGDTGPMHVAAAVGTPIVAVFGPSDPARYAPRGAHDRIVRVDLPCSPCNRIRLPPARCTGHTPDCLTGVTASSVFDAATGVLDATVSRRAGLASSMTA